MDTNLARNLFAGDRFAALTGVEILSAGPGHCKACLAIEDKHLNAANVVQGGAIFTLADLAFDPKGKSLAAATYGGIALWYARVAEQKPQTLKWMN